MISYQLQTSCQIELHFIKFIINAVVNSDQLVSAKELQCKNKPSQEVKM